MQTRTRRQHEVLEYLTEFITERGYEPSYQQIARAMGVRSKGAIAKHIEALESQGLISRKRENGSFGIELLSEQVVGSSVLKIDWLDIPLVETQSDGIILSKSMLGDEPSKNLRVFRVPNDAMLDENICEGDIALVEKRSFARDRDCVVALIERKRAVLKKMYRRGAKIELRPANDDYESIILSANKIKILAVYKGLIRPIA